MAKIERPSITVPLTHTMDRFLTQVAVTEGRALNECEVVRWCIGLGMERWAQEHGQPFPNHEPIQTKPTQGED